MSLLFGDGAIFLASMAVVGYIGVQHLWLWWSRRSERLSLWVAGWCAASLLFLIARSLQTTRQDEAMVLPAGRLAWLSGLLLVILIIGLTHALARRPWGPLALGAAGLDVALMGLVWLTDAIVSGQAYLRTDLLGDRYWSLAPGPLMPLVVPYLVGVFLYGFRVVWRAEGLEPGERRALLAGFVAYFLLALNDVLHAARLVHSIRVFDYGFVAVALGLNYLLVRRYSRLSSHLEEQVAARTRELETGQARLAALLRSGQAVMAERRLQAILDRIVAEAAGISGTPHVTVLLVDREAGVVRPAAGTGGSAPAGLEAPLGGGLSGRVVATGEPLLVPDTRKDAGALLADRDRALGIVGYLGLPIRARGEVLGVLAFSSGGPRAYAPEEIAVLSSFADQAATAIENARLDEALERRVLRMNRLTRLSQLVSSSLDTDRILKQIAAAAAELMEMALVLVWTADEARQSLEVGAASDEALLAGHPNRTLRFGEGIVGLAAARRRPVVVPDFAKDPRAVSGEWLAAQGLRSGAAVPIMHGDRLLGVLSLVSRGALRLGPDEWTLVQSFVAKAAVALTHARLYEGREAQVVRLRTLTRLNRLISSSLDADRLLREIAGAAARLLEASVASFWLADEETRSLELTGFSDAGFGADFPVQRITFDQGVIGWVARHGRSLAVPDAFADGRFMALDWMRAHGLRSFLGLPVILDGRLLAVLGLNGREPFDLTPADEELLEGFLDQAAVAIRNARLYAAEGAARLAAERALSEVRRLQGLLPICSYCKKIRGDQDSWEQLESYISQHSDATFSHGICPDCRESVRGDLLRWRGSR